MKMFLVRFLLTSAIAFLTPAIGPLLHAQQADQDPAPATSSKTETNKGPQQNEGQIPASGEITAQDAKVYSGRVVQENGDLVLKDPVTKVAYKLSNQQKAKHYVGMQVKVTGKLDKNSNSIQVDRMEPSS